MWTLVFLFSVRRGCWLLREWSSARSCARGAARRVPVSERRRRRRGLATEVSPRRPSGRSSPVPYRTGRTVRGVALLSCAVSVRSHWSGVKRLAWCSRGSPVRSRPWPGRARRVGPAVAALGSARGPPPPLRARGDFDWEDLCFVLTVVTNTVSVNSAVFPQQPTTVWCRWHEEAEPTGPSEATKLDLTTDVTAERGDDIRDTVGEATVQGRTQRLVHHESCAGKPPRSPSRSRRARRAVRYRSPARAGTTAHCTLHGGGAGRGGFPTWALVLALALALQAVRSFTRRLVLVSM